MTNPIPTPTPPSPSPEELNAALEAIFRNAAKNGVPAPDHAPQPPSKQGK